MVGVGLTWVVEGFMGGFGLFLKGKLRKGWSSNSSMLLEEGGTHRDRKNTHSDKTLYINQTIALVQTTFHKSLGFCTKLFILSCSFSLDPHDGHNCGEYESVKLNYN